MSGNSSSSTPRTERLLLRLSLPGREPIEAYVARRLFVGRSPDNVFVIDDPSVDRHHAEVHVEEKDGINRFVLRCLSSDACVEVEGQSCTRVLLCAGVRFRIGPGEFECLTVPGAKLGPEPSGQWAYCPYCQSGKLPPPQARPQTCAECGKEILVLDNQSGQLVALPAVVGPCTGTSLVAQGGMAWVLRGYIPAYNRPVAIKILRPELAGQDSARRRFEQEFDVLQRLKTPICYRCWGAAGAGNCRTWSSPG